MIKLQDWFMGNMPSEELIFETAAKNQIMWVRDSLAPILGGQDNCTVVSTHTSKSVLLPVYHFVHNDIEYSIRGNFHDWCVRLDTTPDDDFPEYMHKSFSQGYYEGMSSNYSLQLCVSTQEELFAILWWLANEGFTDG